MARKNPFDGKGKYTNFVWLIYKRMQSRNWFSHADVMADKLGLSSAMDLEFSISKCPNNGELKKAFRGFSLLIIFSLAHRCGFLYY